ncbi:FxLD family lanthipeptide [Streptomyces sp. NBC_01262]|uniref:FxLD family lanthipeptide n=1 Tax=Streptomyces sp. NBC_01262 TaxID=2903803 RepID=UPI002E305D74|nr:FxLD family lanthipeptide [Streptomyces sp. NBC_01262]
MSASTIAPPPRTQLHSGTTTEPTDGFHLDVRLVEVADPASLVNMTDDNCGSSCGACTTGVA